MNVYNKPQRVLDYLQEKYDEEFVIENFEQMSVSEYGSDKLIVHPKGKEDLPFLICESEEWEEEFYDTYLLAIWEKQLKEELTTTMENILGDDSLFNVIIRTPHEKYNMSHFNMEFTEYIKNINNYGILTIIVAMPSIYDVTDCLDKIYQIYKLVETYGMDTYSVSVGFVDDNFDSEEYLRTAGINNIDWSNFKSDIKGYVTINNFSKIETSADIINEYISIKED